MPANQMGLRETSRGAREGNVLQLWKLATGAGSLQREGRQRRTVGGTRAITMSRRAAGEKNRTRQRS